VNSYQQHGGRNGAQDAGSMGGGSSAALGVSDTPTPSPEPRPASGGRWYVAQVLSQKEAYAAEHLTRQGFQTFCPRFYRAPSRAGQKAAVLAPLFPGYIFVKFDIKADRWLAVNSTRGVIRLVGPRLSAPSAVSADLIGLLMSRCSGGILDKLPDYIRAGDHIQISAGPLAGQIAQIESFDDRGRVKVLLRMLGAEHSVSVTADQLAPVAAT
jgi:transcriptional antiterminator RfaH